MLTRPEVDEADTESLRPRLWSNLTRPRPTVTRPRPRPKFFSAKFYVLTPFSQKKNEIFDDLRRDFRKFRRKTGFNIGTLLVNTPKTTSCAFGRRLLLQCLHTEQKMPYLNKALQQHFKNYEAMRPSWTRLRPQLL